VGTARSNPKQPPPEERSERVGGGGESNHCNEKPITSARLGCLQTAAFESSHKKEEGSRSLVVTKQGGYGAVKVGGSNPLQTQTSSVPRESAQRAGSVASGPNRENPLKGETITGSKAGMESND